MHRIVVTMLMFENRDLRSKAPMIGSMSAAVVNLLLIMAVGRVYEKLALRLTQWGK